MEGVKRFTYSVLLLSISLICVDVADGYAVFLSSSQEHFRSHDGQVQQVDRPESEPEDPKKEVKEKKKKDYNYQYKKGDITAVEKKYPFIYGIHEKLEAIVGKRTEVWYQDWKLWIGLLLWSLVWAKWLKNGYDEIWMERGFFAFGLNIVILHVLQYAPSVKIGVIGVCLLLSAQSCLQNIIVFRSSEREGEPDKFLCDTLYLDLSLPAAQIGVLFISQCCVWWFYMTSIIGNFDLNEVNYTFWLVAFLTMQMTMILCRGDDSVLGNPFPVHDVFHLWQECDGIELAWDNEAEGVPFSPRSHVFQISALNVLMRGIMGFFCNAILREIMSYTIPLLLMGFSEPMDFVVYCVGVNFICTIDDMKDRSFSLRKKGSLQAAAES